MFGVKDHHRRHHNRHLSTGDAESSLNHNNPDEKKRKGIDFLQETNMGGGHGHGLDLDGSASKPQELTLSYLCEKGKDVMASENLRQDQKWVERDFLNLSQTKSNSSSKREAQRDEATAEAEESSFREKKPKLESSTLNLSLALPDVSLSLTASNALQNGDHVVRNTRPSQSIQSLGAAPSNTNNMTQTTCSNDFTAASLSYSYSHPFSHNPSCSMTRNSTENYDYSVGRDDQIWCGGEGTNGSVHSRFRPIGDGIVALNNSNHGAGGSITMLHGNRVTNKESCNDSLHMTTSSENISFFPSELPAKLRMEAYSGDSRRKDSENFKGFEDEDGRERARNVSRSGRILREIVSESIPVTSQIIQELSEETLESVKEYLKNLIVIPEKREELVGLQNRLERRSDFSMEALLKCQKAHLEILVALKMELGIFISGKVQLTTMELVEIFLFIKCRNVNCKSVLPVDDCDCKFCSGNKGFCSSCMCPVCMKFDCASNTCSWVGCDVCSHWCHAACGIQKNLIRPGPSLKGPSGTTEMQFHCIGCNHASEMFGFVKDVFLCCARDWGVDALTKELDCVKKIFKGSEDFKGKQLHNRGEELLSKLEKKIISPQDARNFIMQFFNYSDGMPDFPSSGGVSAKELMPAEPSLTPVPAPVPAPVTSLPPKYTVYNMSSSSGRHDSLSKDVHRNDIKAAFLGDLKLENDFHFGNLAKKEGLDSLESMVRIKEAEASMFQGKADEARREAEGYRRLIRANTDKLDEEYAEKLSKLCLQETEERRRKKLEELKVLENTHCDYFNMKLRMQAEIAGLLERMEATKQQWV